MQGIIFQATHHGRQAFIYAGNMGIRSRYDGIVIQNIPLALLEGFFVADPPVNWPLTSCESKVNILKSP